MKRNIKRLLFGFGIITAGYIAYEIYIKRELESEILIPDTKIYKPKPDSKAYLDKRRKIIKKAYEKKLIRASENSVEKHGEMVKTTPLKVSIYNKTFDPHSKVES